MRLAAEILLAFVALYPVCTAALWISGGLLFRGLDELPPIPVRSTNGRGDDPDTGVQRGGRDRDVHRLCAHGRLPAPRGSRPRRRLDRRHRSRRARRRRRRSAMQGAPRPGQPWEGGAAQRRLPRGPARARRGDGRRHARAPGGAQAPCREDGALSARRSGRRFAARHEPRQADPGAPGARGGVDHRLDPQDAVAHRPCRRRRGRARALPSRARPRRRRLRVAHGDRGHRPDVEAPPRRMAHRVRAARAGRDAGAVPLRPCGRSASAGPAARARCSTSTSDR